MNVEVIKYAPLEIKYRFLELLNILLNIMFLHQWEDFS
jgi:hypothetical protein